MPNVTIYLNDEEFIDFTRLSKEEQTARRQKAKKKIVE